MYLYDINVAGNIAYALEGIETREGFRIVSFTLDNPKHTTVVREEKGSDGFEVSTRSLLLVGDSLYFVSMGEDTVGKEDDRFMSMSLTTGEEKVIEAPYFTDYFVDNGKVYFINEKDDRKLYSMSLDGGELTKLTDFKTYYAFMYEGRIYYIGRIGDMFSSKILMSMNPDGTNHKMHTTINFIENAMAFSDGKLYRYEGDAIAYIDMKDETFTEQVIPVKEQVVTQIQNYYADYLERKLDGKVYSVDEVKCKADISYVDFGVSNGYACFTPDTYFGHWIVREAFICDLETGEVSLLNEYFDVGSHVEKMELTE